MALGNNVIPPLYTPNADSQTNDYLVQILPKGIEYITDLQACEGLYLSFLDDTLSLCHTKQKGQVTVDFTAGKLDYRRQKGGGEQIAKAVNYKENKTIIDATAGLGRDSFILASHGMDVYLFEQHPIVAALLADGIRRGRLLPELDNIMAHMHLHHQLFTATATEHLPKVDVVYLDPMYPHRQKSAAIKKEMAYFHELVGIANSDEADLLQAANALAKKRIVVKRPRLGEFLNQQKPAYQYEGKSTRFDVYLPSLPTVTSN